MWSVTGITQFLSKFIPLPDRTSLQVGGCAGEDRGGNGFAGLAAVHDTLGDRRELPKHG